MTYEVRRLLVRARRRHQRIRANLCCAKTHFRRGLSQLSNAAKTAILLR